MNRLDKQLKEGAIYARLPQYRKKEEQAFADIRTMLELSPRSYVSLSWGKQSIILAHMVCMVAERTPCVHWSNPNSELLANFAEVRDQFLSWCPLNYTEFPEGDTDLKGNGTRYMQENGLTGVFMGLAADESKGRKYTLKAGKETIRQYANGFWRCCPLAAWSIFDLAAYLSTRGLPLLTPYHKYGLEMRTSTGATPGSHSERGLDFLSSTQRGEYAL